VTVTRARRPAAADVLSEDHVLRDALALAFMVARQEAIDIACHVVADEGWGIPDSHRAAFELLAAHRREGRVGPAAQPSRASSRTKSADAFAGGSLGKARSTCRIRRSRFAWSP
jgi:hypothetical protein